MNYTEENSDKEKGKSGNVIKLASKLPQPSSSTAPDGRTGQGFGTSYLMQERLKAVSTFSRTPPQKLKRCVWHKAFAWILYNCTNIFSFISAHPPRKGCLSANNRLWKVKNACETRNIYFKKVWSGMLACRAIPFLKCYAATQQIFWLFIICCWHSNNLYAADEHFWNWRCSYNCIKFMQKPYATRIFWVFGAVSWKM